MRGVLATTGLVAAADAAPDSGDAEIEVLEHIEVPAVVAPGPERAVVPAASEPRPERQAAVAARSPRSKTAVAGWLAIVIGIALVAAAGWLILG